MKVKYWQIKIVIVFFVLSTFVGCDSKSGTNDSKEIEVGFTIEPDPVLNVFDVYIDSLVRFNNSNPPKFLFNPSKELFQKKELIEIDATIDDVRRYLVVQAGIESTGKLSAYFDSAGSNRPLNNIERDWLGIIEKEIEAYNRLIN